MVRDPLRVLVIAPTPFFGDRGCHVRIYEEVRGLMARGIEVRVVTYPTGRDLDGIETVRARATGSASRRRHSARRGDGPCWT